MRRDRCLRPVISLNVVRNSGADPMVRGRRPRRPSWTTHDISGDRDQPAGRAGWSQLTFYTYLRTEILNQQQIAVELVNLIKKDIVGIRRNAHPQVEWVVRHGHWPVITS